MNQKFNFIDAVKTLFKYSKNNKKLYIKSVIYDFIYNIRNVI